MKILISDNIRSFRKERKLTQEQLAEVLGVTVGAVSKWEAGISTPDLSLIVEMASFFETSVDVLLGYEWHKGTLGQALELIHSLRNEKRFDEACSEAEKALKKYPNCFELVYKSAVLYCLRGVEQTSKKAYQRALALLERSLELIEQNTDEHINEWTIRNQIASVYLGLDQTDKALEQMKSNNADGLNDGDIGYTLATAKHDADAALPYLSDAFVSKISELFRISMGYANAYMQKKDYENALAIMQWMYSLLSALKVPGKPTYIDRESVLIMCNCAYFTAVLGRLDEARELLRRTKEAAEKFDAAPSFSFCGMRFFHGNKNVRAFDSFGVTSIEGIVKSFDEDPEAGPILKKLWSEL